MSRKGRLDGLAIVGVAFFVFMILNVLKDQGLLKFGFDQGAPIVAAIAPNAGTPQATGQAGGDESSLPRIELAQPDAADLSQATPQPAATPTLDSDAIAPPYAHYFLTQGPHGADYGHMAIDISAGKGATILSPINGWVSNFYIDDWGNPSLDLENDRYIVELLHGIYTVKIGDQVTIGQPIGQESNQGNTVDPNGVSCRGRDCGYHTHINVFDKKLGTNVNPLDLFPAQQ